MYEYHLTPYNGWRWVQLIDAGWWTEYVTTMNMAKMKRAVSSVRVSEYQGEYHGYKTV